MNAWRKVGLFVGGAVFGSAGLKVLSSKDFKKAYVQCTAAALRMKDCAVKTATNIQENAEDILAEAKQVNEERYAEDASDVVEDTVTKVAEA